MRKFQINIIDTRSNHLIKERFAKLDDLKLSYKGSDSQFDSIMASDFSFSIDNDDASDGRYLDLFGGDERKFRIEVLELLSLGVKKLFWQGYLLPDIYSEPYENVRFFVQFTASDGLGALREKPFTLYKTSSVVKIICRCLFETGLKQEVYFAPGVVNSALNWNEIQILEEYFNDVRKDGSVKRSNCYDVLLKMLQAVGATLFTVYGKWYIVGYNRKHLVTDQFVVYNAFGGFLRNELVAREVYQGVFSKGLNVIMSQSFRSVELNVSYDRSSDEIFKEEFISNPDLTGAEIDSAINNTAVRNNYPLKHWSQNGQAKKMLGSEDGKQTLKVAAENVSGGFPVFPAGVFPSFETTGPGYVRVYNPTNTTTDWNNDYIELKDVNALYLSPQRDNKPQEFKFKAELSAYPYVRDTNFTEDFYRQVFRFEIYIGDHLLLTTRGEVTGYDSSELTVKFVRGSTGPLFRWYQAPNNFQIAGSAFRWSYPDVLNAEMKDVKRSSVAHGPLKIRLYVPRNKDNAKTLDGKHVLHVLLKKFEIEVNDWDDEIFIKSRGISSTNNIAFDLPFSDGKSDLYNNLFKLAERVDYPMGMSPNDVLATGYTSSDLVNYYITWPSNVSGGIVERIKNNFSTIRIGRDNELVYLYQIFGDLSKESGCYINDAGIFTISKSRIDEFPEYRDLLHNMNRLIIPQLVMPHLVTEYTRNQYVSWKRHGSASELRYLEQYARMVHECQSVVSPRLTGALLRIITPLDLVRFNYLGEKNFFPSRMDVDFSTGKTNVFMIEANYNTVEDYVN